jgi:acyl-coenzyme A synthetase/AMP-(fatty) acid ligase
MKLNFSDYSSDNIYLNNPQNGRIVTYNQIFANAYKIANSQIKYPNDSLILILAKDECLLLSSIIACWLNKFIPAVYSPSLNESEYLYLQNKYQFVGIISEDIINFNNQIKNINQETFSPALQIVKSCFEVEVEKIALVLFSSGTTGEPKAIPLSFSNILKNVDEFRKELIITNENIFLCASPIWHAHGLYNSFLTAFFLKTQVIYAGQLNIMNVNILFKAIKAKKNIVFHITPSMIPILLAISKKIPSSELPNFYKIICGTSFLDKKSKLELENTYKINLIQQYGMTETLFISVNQKYSKEKDSSVGVPLSNVKLEIWENKILSKYEVGAIRLKSTSWYGNYYGENKYVDDDYFYTGDLGYLDKDNCLFITGRIKDLIKKGGFSISADEITKKLLEIKDIEDAYTLSIVDSNLGEEIYAFYVSDREVSIQFFISELSKSISVKLLPKAFFKVDMILKTDTGKVSKPKMEKILKSILND